jgi:hypothetical protein
LNGTTPDKKKFKIEKINTVKIQNHIREIPTENLKLVAIAWVDVQGDDDCGYSSICRHDAYPGSEVEYRKWCEVQSVDTNWSCSICGHSLKYNCVVQDTSTELFYDIGRDCCQNLQVLKSSLGWLDSKQANAAKCVAAGKKAQNARRAGDVREEEFAIAKPEIGAAFTYAKSFPNNHALWHKVSWHITTLRDLRSKVRQYGSLSEKQEAFALDLHKQAVEKLDASANEVAIREAAIAAGLRAPEGKHTVKGVIKSVKWVDSDFGGAFKTLVELENGTRVYGTLPSDQHENSAHINGAWVTNKAEVGDKVEITATFEVSQKDTLFGFYKRPKFKNADLTARINASSQPVAA